MDALQPEKVGNCVGFQMLARFKGTVWSGHKGSVWNRQGLALDSMLTSLQITLINDNSEWKRPFRARDERWESVAGYTPVLNVAFMSQGQRSPRQAANGPFFFSAVGEPWIHRLTSRAEEHPDAAISHAAKMLKQREKRSSIYMRMF